MRINVFFTYFGGKYRIAPYYPKPRFNTVIEPFAGSAGYATRYYKSKVILYDLNPIVCSTWDYLIKTPSEEILALPLVFDDVRDLKICQEAKWLIGWWLNKGTAKPCNKPGKWMRDVRGGAMGLFWGNSVCNRIAKQVRFIRHWKVFNLSYEEIPNQKACWYIDPPYQRSGKHYTFNDIDYPHLSQWAQEREGQVICCGQEGDDWVPFHKFLSMRAAPGKYKTEEQLQSKEVIWVK